MNKIQKMVLIVFRYQTVCLLYKYNVSQFGCLVICVYIAAEMFSFA